MGLTVSGDGTMMPVDVSWRRWIMAAECNVNELLDGHAGLRVDCLDASS